MHLADLVRRADEILSMGSSVISTRYSDGPGGYAVSYVASAPMAGFRAAVLSFLQGVVGRDHPHYQEFEKETRDSFLGNAERGIAILQAVRDELAGGWVFTVKGLVAAELFADFLSMAEHLLESGYKDPAAVLAGSVLEEHLRQLSTKRGIPVEDDRDGKLVPRKADRINVELAKGDVYNKLDQKLITAWLDLRNHAAHGHYTAYTDVQVSQMLSGILEFIARKPL
jgi:hypothetical protein